MKRVLLALLLSGASVNSSVRDEQSPPPQHQYPNEQVC